MVNYHIVDNREWMGSVGIYKKHVRMIPGYTWSGLLMFLCLLIILPLGAQSDSEFSIKWIAEFPGEKRENKVNFGDRVSRIVFGKKAQEVIKPFNIFALDPQQFWILDQGGGAVFEVREGRGSKIKSMKRAVHLYPSLVGICRTKEGDLLFTDSRLNQVIQSRGDQVRIFGDSLVLQQPTGIACDPLSGHILIVETGAHRISRYDRDGQLISRFGERGTGPGCFNFPTFIWIDKEGQIYLVDSMNQRIQIFNNEGDFLGTFGELGDATGYMARPKGVATDSRGHVYVADALFHAIQIFDKEGRFLYSFGGQGQGPGEFWMPTGLYIDDQDYIYVADSYNARVQIFRLEKN